MITDKNQRLIIFVKSPIAGKVKTRLAQECSAEQASLYYQAMVACVLEHIAHYASELNQPLNIHIGYTLSDNNQAIKDWLEPYLSKVNQLHISYFEQFESSCLGERIHHAFDHSFAEGYQHVSIIGTDCISITPTILHQLFKPNHSMIGPTYDGGYYALSLQAKHFSNEPESLNRLFFTINWSSPSTYQDTLDAAQAIDLELQPLPKLHDIDYLEDWERALKSVQGSLLQDKLSVINRKIHK